MQKTGNVYFDFADGNPDLQVDIKNKPFDIKYQRFEIHF